jgi:hypothetical protein
MEGFKDIIIHRQSSPSEVIFARNMAALKNRYPDLYEALYDIDVNDQFVINSQNSEGIKNLIDTKRTVAYYDIDTPVKSIINSIDNIKFAYSKLVGFYGLGLGYELLYYDIYYKEEKFTSNIFVIEKEIGIFVKALIATDLSDIISDSKIEFIIGKESVDLFMAFSTMLKREGIVYDTQTINIIPNETSIKLEGKYYLTDAFDEFKKATTRTILQVGDSPYDAMLGMTNTFANVLNIRKTPGVNCLNGKFEGKPAIVVSSGPSLMKEIELLKTLKDRALILTAESTLKILMDNGITPHIMCTLERPERLEHTLEHFDRPEIKDVYMACASVIPKSMMERYKGPKLIAYRSYDYCNWIELNRGMLTIRASSSSMAFELAAAFGCTDIILVGQDLCFDRETNKSHAPGHFHGDEQNQNSEHIEVPANDGGISLTQHWWNTFRMDFEEDLFNMPYINCINTAEKGAVIKGAKYMSLKEAALKYLTKEFDSLKIIADAVKEFIPEGEEEYKAKMVGKYKEAIEYCTEMITLCADTVKLIDGYHKKLDVALKTKIIGAMELKTVKKALEEVNVNKLRLQEENESIYMPIINIVISPVIINNDVYIYGTPQKYDDPKYAFVVMLFKYKKYFADIKPLLKEIIIELKKGLLVVAPDYDIKDEELEFDDEIELHEFDDDIDCDIHLDDILKDRYFK